MKRLFQICLFAIVFTACNSSANQEKKQQWERDAEYFNAIEQAENSPQIEKNLFLGFKFGMTPNEVKQHINKLRKEKKIHVDQFGDYYYIFHTNHGDAKMTFSPAYYNDSLYRMQYGFTGMPGAVCIVTAKDLFDKANLGYKSYTYQIEGFRPELYRIKDNVIVMFDFDLARMTYTNAPITKQIEAKNKRKTNETLLDF